MASLYKFKSVLLNDEAQTLGASETDTVVSEIWTPSAADALNLRVSLKATAVTAATAVSFNVQQSPDQTTWTDLKGTDVSITGNGWFHLLVNVETSADQDKLPLLPFLRVTCSSDSGDALTVSELKATSRG